MHKWPSNKDILPTGILTFQF